MKCDGLPDPACVKQLNTYLTLWREDGKEEISSVLQTTLDVLPIMASLESIIENPGMQRLSFDVHRSDTTHAGRFVRQYFGFALGRGFEPQPGAMSQFFKLFQETTTHEWYRHPVQGSTKPRTVGFENFIRFIEFS